ncbi:MAG: NYN domain-containing protein [Acidobacteriota bacterium]
MPLQDKMNIAVFVDYDNIEIGLKTTLRREFDVSLCLDALKERGDIVAKFAYANWGRQEGAARQMAENAVQMVQRLPSPRGDKNGGDINLALDALEMAFTHTHVNAFAIISGDSDFIPLVNKLKEYGKTVFVVGGKAFTSNILQSNCHEFVAYENLLMDRAARLDGAEGGPQLERLKQELTEAISRSDQGGGRWDRGDRDRGDRDRGDRDRGGDRVERILLPGEKLSGGGSVASATPPLSSSSGSERISSERSGSERSGRESRWERRDRRREERRDRGEREPRPERQERAAANNEPRVVQDISAALPLVDRSLQTLERRGVQAQLGLLKSTMMQLDPTFHERGFGASSFSDFIDKLKKAELIEVEGTGGKLTIQRKGGANAKPLPEPEEALPLLRDALEAHRYEMEMGDGVEPVDLAQWINTEHPGFDVHSYGFPGFHEFLVFSEKKGVVSVKKEDERGIVVYLGREFFPPPAPKEEKEEDFYSEYDEIQPYVEGQPSLVDPNPPPPKPKKATRARKTTAKKSSSSSRPRKRKSE